MTYVLHLSSATLLTLFVACPCLCAARHPLSVRSDAVGIVASVVPLSYNVVDVGGVSARTWAVPERAAGWLDTSARPGEWGNAVLIGHSGPGRVFNNLGQLSIGDNIEITSRDGRVATYVVAFKTVVDEAGASPAQRVRNGRWIGAFDDARLTLLTCWPPGSTDSRLIVVAKAANLRPPLPCTCE